MTALNSASRPKEWTGEEVINEYRAWADQFAEEERKRMGIRPPEDLRPYMVGGMASELARLRNEKAELMERIENFKLLEV